MDPNNLPEMALKPIFRFFRLAFLLSMNRICRGWGVSYFSALREVKSMTLLLGGPRQDLLELISSDQSKFAIREFDQLVSEQGQRLLVARSDWNDVLLQGGLNKELCDMLSACNLRNVEKLTIVVRFKDRAQFVSFIDYIREWAELGRGNPNINSHLTTFELYVQFTRDIGRIDQITKFLNDLRTSVNEFVGSPLRNLTLVFRAEEENLLGPLQFPILAQLHTFRHYSSHSASALICTLNQFGATNDELRVVEVLNRVITDGDLEQQLRVLDPILALRFTRNCALEHKRDLDRPVEFLMTRAALLNLCGRFTSITVLNLIPNQEQLFEGLMQLNIANVVLTVQVNDQQRAGNMNPVPQIPIQPLPAVEENVLYRIEDEDEDDVVEDADVVRNTVFPVNFKFLIRCCSLLPNLVSLGFDEQIFDQNEEADRMANGIRTHTRRPVLRSVKILRLSINPRDHRYFSHHGIARIFPQLQRFDLDVGTGRLFDGQFLRSTPENRLQCIVQLFEPIRRMPLPLRSFTYNVRNFRDVNGGQYGVNRG